MFVCMQRRRRRCLCACRGGGVDVCVHAEEEA